MISIKLKGPDDLNVILNDQGDVSISKGEDQSSAESLITPNEFKESMRKVELFIKQSDFLFDTDDIQLFTKFKSRLDLIQ